MEEKDDELSLVAMQVILNAGNARKAIDDGIEYIAKFDFAKADAALALAEDYILKAHNAQTGIIQRQAAGEKFEYSLLFAHAQDTLMTIDSELHLIKKLLPVFKALCQRKQLPNQK